MYADGVRTFLALRTDNPIKTAFKKADVIT